MEGERKRIKSYRDLVVWQKAHEHAKKVIGLSGQMPQSEEARIIKRQLLRSATSIPANIAEGYGGNHGRVFQNALTIARRETLETDYWLLLCYELGYIDRMIYEEVEQGYQEVRAMLSSFISKLEKPSDS